MQKLSEKLKDTPTNTSLVRSSVSRSLNKEKTLSVIDKVRSDNNSEENLPVSCGSGMSVVKNSTHHKNHTPIHSTNKVVDILGGVL